MISPNLETALLARACHAASPSLVRAYAYDSGLVAVPLQSTSQAAIALRAVKRDWPRACRTTNSMQGTATWYLPSEVAGDMETSMTSRGVSGRPLIEKTLADPWSHRDR